MSHKAMYTAEDEELAGILNVDNASYVDPADNGCGVCAISTFMFGLALGQRLR